MIDMNVVELSPKYQILIPKEIREESEIQKGDRMEVIAYENRIELILIKPIQTLKGFLKGIDTNIERDEDRL